MEYRTKNEKMRVLLEEKRALILEGRDITKEIEALEAKRNKLGMKIQKIKDKVIPMAMKLGEAHAKPSEFEVLVRVDVDKDDVIIEYADQLEEFKQTFRARREAEKEEAK